MRSLSPANGLFAIAVLAASCVGVLTNDGVGGAGGDGQGGDSGGAGVSGGAGDGAGGTGQGGGGTGTGGAAGTASGSGGSVGAGGSSASGGGSAGSAGKGGGGAGGKGGGGGAAGGASAFAPVAAILGTSCGTTAACHGGTDHVDLRNNAGLYGRIVSKMPNGAKTSATCKPLTLIVPGSTANSVISSVIKAKFAACTGAQMPDGCPGQRACLTGAQIATIDAWITAGAPM